MKLLFYLCTPSTMRKKDRKSAGMKRVSEIPNFMALVKIIMKLGLVWLHMLKNGGDLVGCYRWQTDRLTHRQGKIEPLKLLGSRSGAQWNHQSDKIITLDKFHLMKSITPPRPTQCVSRKRKKPMKNVLCYTVSKKMEITLALITFLGLKK